MNSLHFQLVTPERMVLSAEVLSVTCPTAEGQITILPGHITLISELAAGELTVRETGETVQNISISGGFLHVEPGNNIIILAEMAEYASEIEEEKVIEAIAAAKARLLSAHAASEEHALLTATLEHSFAKLRTVRKSAHRRRSPITSEGVLEE